MLVSTNTDRIAAMSTGRRLVGMSTIRLESAQYRSTWLDMSPTKWS
jgi:hypothetical protein